MKREILVSAGAESWVAITEDGRLAQLMLDRPDRDRIVGHVFKGRVEAVLPGIQAAFVDIGLERSGFLGAGDLGVIDDGEAEEAPDGGAPRIEERLKRGDWVLVQVSKEAIGRKGPKLTADISLAGRSLVYLPHSGHVGVSRRIDDPERRRRLRCLALEVVGDSGGGGVIVRTTGEELTAERMRSEHGALRRTWEEIGERARSLESPGAVHQEARLVGGAIRDIFSDSFDAVRVEPQEMYREVRDYVREVAPDLVERVLLHTGAEGGLLEEFGVFEELRRACRPQVEMESGGHLVIEATEALVAIDVNTGSFTGSGESFRDTVLRTNLEAAREIAWQLRLRDVGGLVVIDFIDMESDEDRALVLNELRSHLARDRARTRACEISPLGLLEMTRQRTRPPLLDRVTVECRSCGGAGRLSSPATVARGIERGVRRAAREGKENRLVVRVHPEVALYVLEEEPGLIPALRRSTRLDLNMMDDPVLREDDLRFLSGPAETDVTDRYR